MITVWLCIITIHTYGGGHPIVVDNLATRADCHRVAQAARANLSYVDGAVCIEVDKAK